VVWTSLYFLALLFFQYGFGLGPVCLVKSDQGNSASSFLDMSIQLLANSLEYKLISFFDITIQLLAIVLNALSRLPASA
jgi:hypothetical protein